MKRGSGCCAVDIYRTAALTSFSNSIKLHNIFIFGMAYQNLHNLLLMRGQDFTWITEVENTIANNVLEQNINAVKFGYTCAELYAQCQLTQTSLRPNIILPAGQFPEDMQYVNLVHDYCKHPQYCGDGPKRNILQFNLLESMLDYYSLRGGTVLHQ